MIDKKFFQKIKNDHLGYVEEQHQLRKIASDILLKSKQTIFALHGSKQKEAESLISEIGVLLKEISVKIKKNQKMQYEGVYQAALEEYVEAIFFYQFLQNKKIGKITGVQIGFEQYIGGLCDFTGELVRRAVNMAASKRYDEIRRYKDITEEVIGELVQFNLTKNLRVKYDQAKRNLKRMEEILYDIAIREK